MSIITERNGVITIKDGSGTPKTITLTFDGAFTLNIPGTDVTFHKDRGVLPDPPVPTLGEDQPMTGSLSAKVQKLSDAAAATLLDLLNAAAGGGYIGSTPWVSTVSGSGRILVDLTYTDGSKTYAMEDCALTGSIKEGMEATTVDISFTCPHPYPTIS